MSFLLFIVGNALALLATAYFVPGIRFNGNWLQLLLAGGFFGLLNMIVKPIVMLLSLPAIVLTLGLFYFVLNGLLLWGFSKLLHWLRNNPGKRERMATALEHCDMIAAVLCGIARADQVARSVCAMGHKWMWNRALGGFPPEDFLASVDPLLSGVRARLDGEFSTSDQLAGHLSAHWAEKLGLTPGIPIPVGAFDAHWDAIGAGVKLGDVVNVIGTSTCIMAISESSGLIPGLCGVVPGSVHPKYTGIEAGLSATGDIFDAIAKRAAAAFGRPLMPRVA